MAADVLARVLLRAAAVAGLLLAPLAGAKETLQIEVDADNPPFMYLSGNRPAGVYPAVIAAAFARIGVPVNIEPRPWKRALLDLDAGRSGVGGIYKNAERLNKYDFSDPIFVEQLAVYYRRRQPLLFRGLPDLYGKQVGVIRGWSYGDDFDRARKANLLRINEASGDRQNLSKLAFGRIDAAVAVVESGDAVVAGENFSDVVRAETLLARNPAHLAFARSARRGALLARFNKALAEMRQDGTLERLIERELAPDGK